MFDYLLGTSGGSTAINRSISCEKPFRHSVIIAISSNVVSVLSRSTNVFIWTVAKDNCSVIVSRESGIRVIVADGLDGSHASS